MLPQRLTWTDRIDYLTFRMVRHLPVQIISAIGWFSGILSGLRFMVFRASWLKEMKQALTLITGDTDQFSLYRRAFQYFGNLGQVMLESTVHTKLLTSERVKIVGKEHALQTGRPIIFVGGHLSNWELTASFMIRYKVPGHVLYWLPEHRGRREVVEALRREVPRKVPGAVMVPAGPHAMRQLAKGMSAGSHIMIFVDEQKDGHIWGPVLGRKLPDQGNRVLAARLAAKYGALVVPVHVRRLGFARYECIIEPALEVPDSVPAEALAGFLSDAIDARVEAWVKAYPEHWFWLGEFVRSRGYAVAYPWKGNR